MKLSILPAFAGLVLMMGGAAFADTPKATLPLVVYAEAGADLPFIPSGYMGDTGNIKMDDKYTTDPHSGKTCLKVDFTSGTGWGGVVWQNPDNNWGEKVGGWNLSGAKTLSFWAKGDKGGEVVTFAFGIIGKDKTNADTGTGKIDKVALTKEWKKYVIDLKGQDMSHIITGFEWVLGTSGSPVTFYLDDVKYE